MRMTLRQLAVFVAVAQEGTVTRASDAVLLTQSAASMALSDLEDGLGSPLFDRQGKRLQLNDLGRHLLPQALEILGRCEAFEQTARGELQGIDLRIGSTLTISDYLMPTLISDFLLHYPKAQLQTQSGNTRQMIDAVNQFQLDIALIEGSCHVPQLQSIAWKSDQLAVCCAVHHPLATKTDLQLDDFYEVDWILREQGSGTREMFDQCILPTLAHPHIRLTLGHNETILNVVMQGLGITCASTLAIDPLVAQGKLVILDTPFWKLTRQLYLLVHRQKYQSPGFKAFLDYCVQQGSTV